MKMTKEQLWDAVQEVFGNDHPYIKKEGQSFIVITVQDVISDGFKDLRVTVKDVIKYYAEEARNISSGIRTLAGHSGDWRPIDNLASMCLEWFKHVNRYALEQEAKKRGMTLKG